MSSSSKMSCCGCGCEDEPSQPTAPGRTDEGVLIRSLNTPSGEDLVEVVVHGEGAAPSQIVVPRASVSPELIAQMRVDIPDLPRLDTIDEKGAVDIRLEEANGNHVKVGLISLEREGQTTLVPLDPNTRRFRLGGLHPGKYLARAAASAFGRGTKSIEVRSSDITRAEIHLDGQPAEGETPLTIAVSGHTGNSVRVRILDQRNGLYVFDKRADVVDGYVKFDRVPLGHWHIDVIDDSGATSCYDADAGDRGLLSHIPFIAVAIDPTHLVDPNPPDPAIDPFFGLAQEYRGLAAVLPRIGIHTLRELASSEGEDLMHRVRSSAALSGTTIPNPIFGGAILDAKAALGHASTIGTRTVPMSLAEGGSYRRAFLPAAAGPAEIKLNLSPDQTAEVTLTSASGAKHQIVKGSETFAFDIGGADLAGAKPIELEIVNTSNARITAKLDYRFPGGIGGLFAAQTTSDNIAAIYRSWAARNPGLSADVVETSLIPENIIGWLDRARTYFSYAGVCSIDDLGTFRLAPNQALHPGAYVAPNKKSVSYSDVVALSHYAFTRIINDSIIYYRPNDTLHDTAIVLAGAWDIRGQTIVIGSDVRELVVIAQSISHDAASRITWEAPALPGPRTYFPTKAANGANGSVPGERGHDGEAGDPDPHPARNGGANAEVAAPIVTMYILDATSNLPPIDLRGQDGGGGGFGQIGGDGGDGAQGEHADSHFFSGCCRAVGWGGDGGDAGLGGRGGQGGRGGPGGRATLLTSDASIAVLAGSPPDVNVNPGGGGPGGPGGGSGAPGHGGPAGSADCELWCPSHPERHGSDGAGAGFGGASGRSGDPGPNVLSDALQVYPITPEQWNTVFNQPHILQVSPTDAEPDEIVTLSGQNFQPGTDKVFFDGVLQPDASASVSSSTNAFFTVPHTAEGGTHPIVIRPAGASSRRSNRVMVRVIPKPDVIPVGTRWLEGQSPSLTGLAFAPGCQVFAEDWSVAGHPGISVPVISNTRTNINLQIPNPLPGALRGVRRLRVRNPDGGTNRAETIVRLGDTILIRVAAFRVLGTTPGIGTARSVTDIASLFTEGDPHSISVPWAQARISFQLAQPVGTITVADNIANIWPQHVFATDQNALTLGPGVAGAINIFFVRDVQSSTAYSWFGGGPIICGDNAGDLSIEHLQAIAAHECGHALCLRHVCDGRGTEPPGTFFNRNCQGGDDAFLMFPFWDTQSGLTIPAGQVDAARVGATHLEEGKTAPLQPAAMLQNGLPPTIPLCQAVDGE